MTKLSIITVNLNNSSGLYKTVESVVSQTFSDYEYIVIDGGSTDGSVEGIRNFSYLITCLVSEPDNGIYNAMNKGILLAKGEYLIFLNSGDVLVDAYTLDKIFNKATNEDIIYGDLIISDNNKNEIHRFPNHVNYNYLISNTIGHPNTFIKRYLFETIGLYNENLKIVSDWEFFLKALIINRVSYKHVNFPVSIFTLDGISSLKSNSGKMKSERESVLINLFPRFNVDFHHYPQLFDSKIAVVYNFFSSNKVSYYLLKRTLQILIYLRTTIKKVSILSYRRLLEFLVPSDYKDLHLIPVIINSFNRLEYLKSLLSWLEKKKFTNIYILDNCSTYPALLEFYNKDCKYKIFRLKENMGHLALWNTEIYKRFINDFYIYTDPDILPIDECPDDFMEHFMKHLKRHPKICKIGFSLKIDDLPGHYSKKDEVIKWELQNCQNEIEPGLFNASIDTTFALYRPREKGDWRLEALRTGFPYQARHLPWYADDSKLSEEDIFYINSKLSNVGQWS